jgi:hypothetical protein
MSFPLYTSLSVNLLEKDLTIAQKSELIKKIQSLDLEAHELVYALIKSFYLEYENGDALILPYNGELSKESIIFNLLDMPTKLRQLLYKFIKLHSKKQQEEQSIKILYSQESLPESIRE